MHANFAYIHVLTFANAKFVECHDVSPSIVEVNISQMARVNSVVTMVTMGMQMCNKGI